MALMRLLIIFILFCVTVFGFFVISTEIKQREETLQPLFVYGTLKNPLIRLYACGCITEAEPTTLNDYRKDGLNIVPDQSSVVNGELLLVSSTELRRLDRYEDVPENYQRKSITINGIDTWVYIKN